MKPAVASSPPPRWLWPWLACFALAHALARFGPAAWRADKFDGDACQHVWWLYRFREAGLFPNDWLADFFAQPVFAPYGYQALYGTLARWVDPQLLSELIPFMLAALTVALAWAVGRQVAPHSAVGALVAAVFAVLDFFPDLRGGLPRTFAFPLLLLATWALLGRRWWLVGLTFLGAALFYPPLVINLGLWVGVVLGWEVLRARRLPAGWPSLVGWGIVATAIIWHAYQRAPQREFGPKLKVAEARQMPELQSGGRSAFFADSAAGFYFDNPRAGLGKTVTETALLAGLLAVGAMLWPRAVRGETWALGGTALLAFGLAHWTLFALHLPNRYVRYALPVFLLLWLAAIAPAALDWLQRRMDRLDRRWLTGAVGVAAVVALALSGVRATRILQRELTRPVNTAQEELIAFLRRLPPDTLVAAHPVVANPLPLRTQRSVLVSEETALPYYRGYYQEIRARTEAVLTALLAADWPVVDALRERYGVDVLVVNRAAYAVPAQLAYHPPFRELSHRLIASGQAAGFVLAAPPPDRILFAVGDWAIIRLVGPARKP